MSFLYFLIIKINSNLLCERLVKDDGRISKVFIFIQFCSPDKSLHVFSHCSLTLWLMESRAESKPQWEFDYCVYCIYNAHRAF